MLSKYFKHEFKNTGRLLLPAFIVDIIVTLLFSISTFAYLSVNNGDNNWEQSTTDFASGFLIVGFTMLFFVIVGISIGVSFLLIVYRFYQTMTGKEAYLTHTLPIKTSHLLLAKTINAFIWCLLIGIIALFSFFIFITVSSGKPGEMYEAFITGLTEGLNIIDINFSYVVLAILSLIAQLFYRILHFFVAIALGQLIKKHRIIGAVGFYLGISSLQNTLSLFTRIGSLYQTNLGYSYISDNTLLPLFTTFVLYLALSIVFFFTTNYIFSKQLNLE